MDGIFALFEGAMNHQVQVEGGIGEEIEYISRRGRQKYFTKAFVAYSKNEADKGHKDRRYDEIYFNRVKVIGKPNRRDLIIYNGNEYLVEHWRKDQAYSDRYDIYCLANVAVKHNLSEIS